MAASRSTSGNAVVLVLIGVALFGALAYTFMRGAKQGTGNLTKQQAKVVAQEVIDYGSATERGIEKLRQNGCSEIQFGFANTVYKMYNGTIIYGENHNANAPVSGECDLYKAAGANLTPRLFENATVYVGTLPPTSTGYGSSGFRTALSPGIGDPAKDELVYILPVVKNEVCMAINTLLGIPNNAAGRPPNAIWNSSAYASPFFPGTLAITDPESAFTGKTAYCARYTSGAVWNNSYFQVVITR